MEASCLNGHGVPRPPSSNTSREPPSPASPTSGDKLLAPRDASFGSAPSLSKPKYPSPASVLDANSVPSQLVSTQDSSPTAPAPAQEAGEMGGVTKGTGMPYGPLSPMEIRSPSPGPHCDLLLPPQPQAQPLWPLLRRPAGVQLGPGRDHLSLMSSQSGDGERVPVVVLLPTDGQAAGRSVVKPLWGHCGSEGSFTTQWPAATSQLATASPPGSMQSSEVLLVHVPVSAGRPRVPEPSPAVQQAGQSPQDPAPPSPGPRWPAGRGQGHRLD